MFVACERHALDVCAQGAKSENKSGPTPGPDSKSSFLCQIPA